MPRLQLGGAPPRPPTPADDDGAPACRVCYDAGGAALVSPCACAGGLQFICTR